MERTLPTPRIKWASRVAQAPIARLYELDAQGIRDDALVETVGSVLYMRARHVQCVARGLVPCPSCNEEFPVRWGVQDVDTTFTCPACGWVVTGRQYHESWQKTDLSGWGPGIDEYIDAYPKARTPVERMLLIDALLHAVHVRSGRPGGNVARSLIEGGRRNSVHAFLDRLAYGDPSEARERWASTPLNRSRRR